MKVLVTGGAGYIGSVVTQQLLRRGHHVVVLDNLAKGHRDAVSSEAEWHQGDITDAGQVLDSSFDAVVHLAAKSLVGESVAHPERYWHGNIVATLKLLDTVREAGVPRFVFSSTAAVYGNPLPDLPGGLITEEHPTMPINPYGASKLAIDHMLAAEAQAHGLGAVSLRYFNVGGASGRLRERHDPETHLIPNLLNTLRHGGEPAQLFGTDYPTADGTAIRDYIHILDLAEAHLLALEWVAPGGHEVFNLGTGTGSSVREVIQAVQQATGREVPVVEKPRRAGDPPVLVASAAKAGRILGWSPQYTLHEIITHAWSAE
ncbi:UDP-glucose 4-epimerase GalE [Nesterenkonia ebinurensis]|uniref:UDP-glucose 4-epimerase GalE n=1 Tax=Nesterenkonia ebinurensis TaxID=2608252 RepID=UPI00123C7B20|nr:UDP-glucose 4-epimerase GalE [Nesterenkonia ebinurensis]